MSAEVPLPVNKPGRQRRLPPWLKRPGPAADALLGTRKMLRDLRLNTVCAEARCPNLSECWARHTATFMIMGDRCTRNCRFCAVHHAQPEPLDVDEPENLAAAAEKLGLRHVVITSVCRDDLPDEGAGHFARCIRAVHERLPGSTVEVLVPDFHARRECIATVVEAAPEVFNHNVEVVERLQRQVRPLASYSSSLDTLRLAKEMQPDLTTKSGVMVGLGETRDELTRCFKDLRVVGCDLLTIGQYLKPSTGNEHAPIERYYRPEEFNELATVAKELGFTAVASGPFVRSSYFAETLFNQA
ncbi:MAG: lipoyl synthase [Planctomycetota bacterium]